MGPRAAGWIKPALRLNLHMEFLALGAKKVIRLTIWSWVFFVL